MLTFKKFLEERVLSIGLKPEHEVHREKHRKEIHDMLHKSYKEIGGYSGIKSGSKEESDAIHHDISHHPIKAVKRDGKLSAVSIYKKQHGRKLVAVGTDGSKQGSHDFRKTVSDDHHQKRAWGEVSGAVEHIYNKAGMPKHPAKDAEKTLGKKVTPSKEDPHKYTRKIGDDDHEKTIMGHIKK